MPNVNDHVRVKAPFTQTFPGVYLVDAVKPNGDCLICGTRQFAAALLDVTTDPLTEYQYALPEIPDTITNPQLRTWLKLNGHFATVKSYMDAQDPNSTVIDFWERQYIISRTSPTVNALAQQLLGLSAGQTDMAFYEASQIAV